MATGFTQRWQGKVLAKNLGVGSGGVTMFGFPGGSTQTDPNITRADLLSIDGAATVTAYSTAGTQNIANPGGIDTISASSALSIFALTAAPYIGARKTLVMTISSGIFVKAAAGTAFNGSTQTVMKSTLPLLNVEMIGRSTTNWEILSIFPVSTAGASLTLSTTT